MRLAVSGSHGTGKSTLITAFLAKRSEYRHEPEAFETLGDDVELGESGEPTVDGLRALLEYTVSAVPFFMVSNMEASLRFYVDGLAFEITHRWVGDDGKLRWCMMRIGAAALMLQEYAPHGHGGSKPEGKLGLGVSICFVCKDALVIYREARARGVAVQTPFVGNAMWVTSLSDPDGYRIDFESSTDVPEETVYSE